MRFNVRYPHSNPLNNGNRDAQLFIFLVKLTAMQIVQQGTTSSWKILVTIIALNEIRLRDSSMYPQLSRMTLKTYPSERDRYCLPSRMALGALRSRERL